MYSQIAFLKGNLNKKMYQSIDNKCKIREGGVGGLVFFFIDCILACIFV